MNYTNCRVHWSIQYHNWRISCDQ